MMKFYTIQPLTNNYYEKYYSIYKNQTIEKYSGIIYSKKFEDLKTQKKRYNG